MDTIQEQPWNYVILALTSFFIIYLLSLWESHSSKLLKKFPGPKGLPIIGNAWTFGKLANDEILPLIGSWYKQYGKTFRIWVINTPIVAISSYKHAEKLLSSSVQIEKSIFYDVLRTWLGSGLVTSGGQVWTNSRKMLTPTFHFKILGDFIEVFNEQSNILFDIMKEEYSDTGKVVDIFPYFIRLTLDTICETAMGKKFNGQRNTNIPFLIANHEMSAILQHRLMRPWLLNDFIWSLTSRAKREKEHLKLIHGFTDSVIKERKEERNARKLTGNGDKTSKEKSDQDFYTSGKKRLAFMDLLLETQEEHNLDDQAIRDQTSTFMFAGHDTTSASLSFTTYLLGCYPEIQEKLHQELDEVFGDDKERPITQEDLSKLKYLDLCVKESLRIYPSAPTIGRKIISDFELEEGLVIPKGTSIILQPYFVHRDPEVYPDPERFDPERFSSENSVGRSPFSFIPFSAGPRNCIGQRFALTEEKIVLAHFFRNFRVESVEKQRDLMLLPELILKPKNGIKIRIFSRN